MTEKGQKVVAEGARKKIIQRYIKTFLAEMLTLGISIDELLSVLKEEQNS